MNKTYPLYTLRSWVTDKHLERCGLTGFFRKYFTNFRPARIAQYGWNLGAARTCLSAETHNGFCLPMTYLQRSSSARTTRRVSR